MAAYTAVVSVTNTIQSIQNNPRFSTCFDNTLIESLREKLDFLLDLIESCNSHLGTSKQVQLLERKIALIAHVAEDDIESYIVDQILAEHVTESSFEGQIPRKEVTESGFEDQIPPEEAIESSFPDQISPEQVTESSFPDQISPEEATKSIFNDQFPTEVVSESTFPDQIDTSSFPDHGEKSSSFLSRKTLGFLKGLVKISEQMMQFMKAEKKQGLKYHGEKSSSFLADLPKIIEEMDWKNSEQKMQFIEAEEKQGLKYHGEKSCSFLAGLPKIIKEMDSMKEVVMKVENMGFSGSIRKASSFFVFVKKIIEEIDSMKKVVMEVEKMGFSGSSLNASNFFVSVMKIIEEIYSMKEMVMELEKMALEDHGTKCPILWLCTWEIIAEMDSMVTELKKKIGLQYRVEKFCSVVLRLQEIKEEIEKIDSVKERVIEIEKKMGFRYRWTRGSSLRNVQKIIKEMDRMKLLVKEVEKMGRKDVDGEDSSFFPCLLSLYHMVLMGLKDMGKNLNKTAAIDHAEKSFSFLLCLWEIVGAMDSIKEKVLGSDKFVPLLDLVYEIYSSAHEAEDVISRFQDLRKMHWFWSRLEGIKKEMYSIKEKMMEVIEKELEPKYQGQKSPMFLLGLQEILEDLIKEKVIEVKKETRLKDQLLQYPTPVASSRHRTTEKTAVVGFDGYSYQLLDWLTGQPSDQQIIPITGMGGIGKTTLARIAYENPLIVRHFDFRAWITISHNYNVREILNETLSSLVESTIKLDRNEEEVGEQLHKILFGRRYFIVLDDMWAIEAWNKISLFFPENHNGSRVVVTTRQLEVANHFGSSGLAVSFLNDDNSWCLFCAKAFGCDGCPPELEEIGKEIAKKCKGLPLSIVVLGGLLRKSSRSQEFWENVSRDVSSFMNSAVDNRCFDILSLSYSRLPARLKPCFLHLGTFPEDREIRVSLLIKLWIAEGFLRPRQDQSLEEVAESYIKDLVDRNLVLVHTFKRNGKTKTCYVHDLLRDLCLRIAEEEKVFCVKRTLDTLRDIGKKRRIIIHGSTIEEEYHTQVSQKQKSTSVTRSLICQKPAKLLPECRLLRVLIAGPIDSRSATFQQVNLRLLIHEYENIPTQSCYKLASSISRLWNLQTLIITKGILEVDAPSEIWEMRQLRHLKFNFFSLPDPPPSNKDDDVALRNLQTLETVSNFRCSNEVYKRMPNIKKLRILYENNAWRQHLGSPDYYNLRNISSLLNLESFRCSFCYECRFDLLQNLKFPNSLKKLTLENCGICWSGLSTVGSLPHLEVLKLYAIAATEPGWFPVEGEFLCLKFLGIYGCSQLICWRADNCHFPVLEKLVLERLWKLEEIPSDIGEISTLERISMYDCNIDASISATMIQKEQENLGNDGLQVEVDFVMTEDLLEFKKRLEQKLN